MAESEAYRLLQAEYDRLLRKYRRLKKALRKAEEAPPVVVTRLMTPDEAADEEFRSAIGV